jgi:Fic family protein
VAAVRYHEGGFPPANFDWEAVIPHLGPTAAAVARFDGALASIPNPDILIAPLSTQEAVLSSRIEGTQATMGEVLEFEASDGASHIEKHDDIQEVLNYRKAMRTAEEMLADLPLCQRVLLKTHEVLLSGVRGANKSPGQFRRVPNWIGPAGCSEDEARFVPISAAQLPEAVGVWERYMNEEARDGLVQLAFLHAEFEALHPFLDGNGRLGRMLVPLFLWKRGFIRQPMFYVSAFFEADRDEYYERLLAVSRDNDWVGWTQFFLRAIREQAEVNFAKTMGIHDLYADLNLRIREVTKSPHAVLALDWIFRQPIFPSSSFVSQKGIPEPSARRMLNTLREAGILKVLQPSSGRRSAVLGFPALLNIAEGREVF